MKPRVTVYVSMETGHCHVSGILRYSVPRSEWLKLARGTTAASERDA